MAVFLERAMRGGCGYTLPPPPGGIFADVPLDHWAGNWIEQLSLDCITNGCGNGRFCPAAPVNRDQMAVFLGRAFGGGCGYPLPLPATGVFADVPTDYWAADWIEELARNGITAGCGNGNYCPDSPVTRAPMAVFLVRTFGL